MKTGLHKSVVALALIVLATASQAKPPAEPRPWSDWSELRLKLQGAMFLSGTVQFQRSRPSSQTDERQLHISTAARFLGATLARSESTCELDPAGQTLSFVERQPKRGRHYRFDDAGYSVDKLRPPKRGLAAPLDDWSVNYTRDFEYSTDDEGKLHRASDSYNVLASLDRLGLNEVGDVALVPIASSKGPQLWRITVEERAPHKVQLARRGRSGKVKLYIPALRLSLQPENTDNVDTDILGLEGEVELWIEARSKTLLSLSGKIPRVPGRVRLRLVDLR